MSATQAIASNRIIDAMGPMINDEHQFNTVINYILHLREQSAPCQFSENDIYQFAEKAESECNQGVGMVSHQEFMQEIATWRV